MKIKESTLEVVELVNELRQENAHLKREIAQIKEQLQPDNQGFRSREDAEDHEEWKLKIRQQVDACLEEIDHCITLFNK